MPRRTRTRKPDVDLGLETELSGNLDLLTDDEIETILFEEEVLKPPGPFNFSAIAGLLLLGVGMTHLGLSLFGTGLDAGFLSFLALVAGLLVFRIGLAKKKQKKMRLSRRRKRKMVARKKARPKKSMRPLKKLKHAGLYKSKKEKMIFGVCGGLAHRFDLEATLVRIVFAAATILSLGWLGPVVYIVLALSMNDPEKED